MILFEFLLPISCNIAIFLRPNKKICVFRVKGLEILGRVGTHIFFLEKKQQFYAF